MRGFNNYRSYTSTPDKIFSALACLTYGLAGFVWLIVSHLRGVSLSSFARFYIFQAIFVNIAIYVVTLILNILLGFIKIMPFIGPIFTNLVYYTTAYPIIFGLSLTSFLIQGIAVYMAIFALLGKYAELPWFSDTVRRMI